MANDAPLLFDVTRLIWRRWAGRHPTGIDRVCLAYLDHFGKNAQAVVQHRRFRRILDRHNSAKLFRILATDSRHIRPALIRKLLESALGVPCSGDGRLYLNIGHTGLDDPAFEHWVRSAHVRPVYLVHDLIPITHPEYCRPGEQNRHLKRMFTVLKTATAVIGNSQATIDELAEFGASKDIALPPTIAAWLGTSTSAMSGQPDFIPGRPSFVMLGTIEARKNHLMLLQLWLRLIEKFRTNSPRLLIIGQRGWECDEVFELLDRNESLKTAVEELGNCGDEAVTHHIANARALLFPSLVEGYGLPLIEALQAGTPVIASDLPVFREIGQGVPDLIGPLDVSGWENAILSYAEENSSPRKEQLSRMELFRAPTWGAHFAKIDSWLDRL